MKKLISLVAFGYMLCSVFVVDSVDAKKRKKSPPPRAEVTDYSQDNFGNKKSRKQAKKFNKSKKNKKRSIEEYSDGEEEQFKENSPEGYSDGEEEQFERKPGKNKAWRKKFKNKFRQRDNENFDDNRNSAEEYSNETEDQFERKPGKNKAWRKKFKNKFKNRNYQQEEEYSENGDNFDERYSNNEEEQFEQKPINKKSFGSKLKNKNFGRKNKNKENPRRDVQAPDSDFKNPELRDNFNGKPLSKKQLKKMRKRQRKLEGKRISQDAEIEQEDVANNSDDWKNEVAAKTSNTIEPVVDSKKINDSSIAVVSNEKMNKISAQPVLAQNEIASADKPNQTLKQESIKTRLAKLSDFHKNCNLIRNPKPVVQLYSGTKKFREDLDRYRTMFSEAAKA